MYHNKYFSKLFHPENHDGGEELQYDAFISYAEDDANFVQEIVGVLENPQLPKHKNLNLQQAKGRTYKFCIHQRDWQGGAQILDNILHSVQRSHRTIILLSESFLASDWCQHEFDEAYRQKKVIVLMMKSNENSMLNFDKNEKINSYIKTYTYLKQEDEHLWKKLAYQLPHKQMAKVVNVGEHEAQQLEMRSLNGGGEVSLPLLMEGRDSNLRQNGSITGPNHC